MARDLKDFKLIDESILQDYLAKYVEATGYFDANVEAVLDIMDLSKFGLSDLIEGFKYEGNIKLVVHYLILIRLEAMKDSDINKFMIKASFQMLDKEYTDEDDERVYQKKLSEVNRKGKSISERMTNQTILKPYLYKLYQKMDEFGYNIREQNEVVLYLYIKVGAYAKDLDSVRKFRERLYKESDAGTLIDYRFFESKPL